MKALLEIITALLIVAFTFVEGRNAAYLWWYRWSSQRNPSLGNNKDPHWYLKLRWVLLPALTVCGFMFGLGWNIIGARPIDIVLLLIFGVLQWTFFYEGSMYSKWNDLNPLAHTDRWRSIGTSASIWNPRWSTRLMFFVFSLFALVILFSYSNYWN